MLASPQELFGVIRQYNPWWDGGGVRGVLPWKRAAFSELEGWVKRPPVNRAVLLSGARQVGKTTLLLQCIQSLLDDDITPERILYLTFDHPLLKLTGLEGVLKLWRELQPPPGSPYLFLDEIQYTYNWQVWLKHQVDFSKDQRIIVTGSAVPLNHENLESGVGRWHTIRLPTLSFFEYLQLKKLHTAALRNVDSLVEIFGWGDRDRIKAAEKGRILLPHFHDYLLRGGFPQTALLEDVTLAQKLLREDIVDKVLKRDMTALYGVRRILDLEKLFFYLCLHDGGILDVAAVCSNLGTSKTTVSSFLELLEAAHLIYRLRPYSQGKEVLRARNKYYLADAAIPGSVMLRGKRLLTDETRLGSAVETAFFKHIFARYYQQTVRFSYWRDRQDHEVDIIAESGNNITPFEVKYVHTFDDRADTKSIIKFCRDKSIRRGYIITRESTDFSVVKDPGSGRKVVQILKIPAHLACYWLSALEHQAVSRPAYQPSKS